MNFKEAVRACLTKSLDFGGTAVRSEFWWFFLLIGGVTFTLSIFSNKLSFLFGLVMALPLSAVTVRRLHDTNRSGWWQFAWFVPLLGWAVLAYLLVQEGTSSMASEDVEG